MPITTSDLHFRLSIKTGSAGNSLAQSDPNAALGKYVSTTDIVDATLNNLFDDISGDENAASTIDYRCFFVYNAHGSLTLQSPKVWLSGKRFTVTSGNATIAATAHGYSNGDMVRVEAEYATDTLATGLSNATTYYIVSAATDSFGLATTSGGTAITPSSNGSGAARPYGTTTVSIAIDDVAASAVGSSSAQAAQITNETTTPSSIGAFSLPTTKAGGLSLSSLTTGQVRAIWVKRAATNSSARNNDGTVIRVEGDTAA